MFLNKYLVTFLRHHYLSVSACMCVYTLSAISTANPTPKFYVFSLPDYR